MTEVTVKVGDLTLKQVNKICGRFKTCTECPLLLRDGHDLNFLCDRENFDSDKLVTVLEEDLK